ncbi:Ycf66 family protein [Leptothoe sp. PORK10 BA2]|uniref:Ycf66 family protein n=1 Tax=Leptothoe sp. PORK10 BA2 TaxID=3110254 RepID=UPI002B1F6D91|nr:Ycf66 family protein [Leptothoe sp. PORK10 BA2]MEA5464370.1 Ycf66 family protein [Leptothoe sp. PORK10 BA2]
MLANLLAGIVGAGSLAFYLIAFVLPEVHRRSDFFWSGVGMFYAVVLWYCARQMQGAVLLGQSASVGLLLWLGYQTLLLRRETTPAAQQTPIRLGKSERRQFNGTISRPIAKDYEFVEDGVEDPLDEALDHNPDSPILIKPAPDEFAPKMVVPAAMPKSNIKEHATKNVAKEAPDQAVSAPQEIAKKRKKLNLLGAVGIFTGWLKDVATPPQKEPKAMIELPPRPPSIPKPDQVSDRASASDRSAQPADGKKLEVIAENPDVTAENLNTSPPIPSTKGASPGGNLLSTKDTLSAPDISATPANLESDVATSAPETAPATSSTAFQSVDEEESNWPENEFWD